MEAPGVCCSARNKVAEAGPTLWRLLALCSHCSRPFRAWLPRDTLRPLLLGARELTRDCSSTPPSPFMSRSTCPSFDASNKLWPGTLQHTDPRKHVER